ncbi:YbfB/YjiJ family MFS transporter [Streptomyces sp. NPDC052727]|uniref:YbfB/YjiJ family MFS transporter n=1 Tax=Streptomyces sp. NPDC052727 TaxID=3154854 RepID=UPI00343F0CA7
MTISPARQLPPWRAISAGASASFVGIGLARFVYTPLLPELIRDHWFSQTAVAYLGAANLAGYLMGALAARPVGRRLGDPRALRWSMVLATLSILACCVPVSVAWFFLWRLASGLAGGVIMVRVAGAVLPYLPDRRRGLAGGAVFIGLGLGIAATGTLIPLLLERGLRATWIGLAVLCAVLTALSWRGWPTPARTDLVASRTARPQGPAPKERGSLKLNLALGEYALLCVSLVPAMEFLVDFVSRGLGQGSGRGSLVWIVYGLGAILGPTAYGLLADRVGYAVALRIAAAVQVTVLGALCTVHGLLVTVLLSVVIGSFPSGIVPVFLGRVHQLVPDRPESRAAAWGKATIVSALFLALSSYGFSYLFDRSGGNHRLLFAIAVGAVVVGLLVDLACHLAPSGRGRRSGSSAEERGPNPGAGGCSVSGQATQSR